jgi:hypothetical protein
MTELIKVTASKKVGDEDREAELMYNFGADLAEATELFGADVVFTNFRAAAKIALQSRMRTRIDKGQDVAELATIWKPGIQLERAPVNPVTAAKNAFANMTPEERAAFLEELKAGM